jgi:type II secretory pathway component PulF
MKKRMTYKDLSRFYNNLAALLESGLTIERGLATMKQGKKSSTLWMMDGIQHHISRGGTFWEGMTHYPKHFDNFQVMIIKGAEKSGILVETFKRLSQYYDNRHRGKQRFLASLIYPLILLHAVVLLPPLKYLVVGSLNRSYWSIVLPPIAIAYGVVGIGCVFWNKWGCSGPLRPIVDKITLCLPVIGKLVRDVSLARVFWSLTAMLTAGVEAVSAAQHAADSAGNSIITQRLLGALYVLEGGRSFKEYFVVSGMLTAEQLETVIVGEESGALAASMERMVRQMEEANTHRFNMVMKGVGILIYFIVAIIVAITVLSFYIGHFKI